MLIEFTVQVICFSSTILVATNHTFNEVHFPPLRKVEPPTLFLAFGPEKEKTTSPTLLPIAFLKTFKLAAPLLKGNRETFIYLPKIFEHRIDSLKLIEWKSVYNKTMCRLLCVCFTGRKSSYDLF